MQKIIDFIIRKKDLLVFFVLLSISLGFIFNTSSLHKSKFILFSSDIVNYTNENVKYFWSYLYLEKTNKRLIEENSYLKNQLENRSQFLPKNVPNNHRNWAPKCFQNIFKNVPKRE